MTLLVDNRPLLDAFRRGEPGAMETVFNEYSRGVFGYLRKGFTFQSKSQNLRFAGYSDPWELENLVQEVFVRAFSESSRMSYDGLRPYSNYLLTIARNLVLDEYRRRERLFAPVDDVGDEDIVPEIATVAAPPLRPDRQLENKEIDRRVGLFVEALDVEERAVFDVRFRRGSSVEASARELSLTEHRVKKIERRIKKRFFHAMREQGYFEGYRLGRKGLERVSRTLVILILGGGA